MNLKWINLNWIHLNWTWFQNKWHVLLISLPIIILILTIRNLIRGYSWKARNGEELTVKEFFRSWGKGIEGITPLQSVKTQMLGTWIIISGVLAGIMINVLTRIEHQWIWITVILSGSLIITLMSMVGLYQRYKILKKVENQMRLINSQENSRVEKSFETTNEETTNEVASESPKDTGVSKKGTTELNYSSYLDNNHRSLFK